MEIRIKNIHVINLKLSKWTGVQQHNLVILQNLCVCKLPCNCKVVHGKLYVFFGYELFFVRWQIGVHSPQEEHLSLLKETVLLVYWLQCSLCRLILFKMDLTIVQLYWRISCKRKLQVVPIENTSYIFRFCNTLLICFVDHFFFQLILGRETVHKQPGKTNTFKFISKPLLTKGNTSQKKGFKRIITPAPIQKGIGKWAFLGFLYFLFNQPWKTPQRSEIQQGFA